MVPMKNAMCEVQVQAKGLVYQRTGGKPAVFGWPVFEISGKPARVRGATWSPVDEKELANGTREYRFVADMGKGVGLTLHLRMAADSPIIRFRYELAAGPDAKLTKSHSADAITYMTYSLARCPKVT
jgi:hypothetical protein